jgi:hypothetical protein
MDDYNEMHNIRELSRAPLTMEDSESLSRTIPKKNMCVITNLQDYRM